jgi:hypothetical protein
VLLTLSRYSCRAVPNPTVRNFCIIAVWQQLISHLRVHGHDGGAAGQAVQQRRLAERVSRPHLSRNQSKLKLTRWYDALSETLSETPTDFYTSFRY